MGKVQQADFEIGEVLGVGTVGTIYRARNRENGRPVAIKVLHPTVMEDELIQARFEREMLILAKLSHPNIVHYYGGGKEGDQWFYVMELLEGGTVKQLLESSGPLDWEETAVCGTQICSALQHAHNHGVIHRDVKPSNLYLTRSGQIKLGDFGIARDVNAKDLTTRGLTVGTYAYMSPEQITVQEAITGKSDLYALGCLLFEMLTGRAPYLGGNFAQLFEQHLRSEPPQVRRLRPDVPEELERLLLQLLAKNPEERPFNARAVQGTLFELLDGLRPEAVEPQAGQPAVAADKVADRVQASLRRRIREGLRFREPPTVSWLGLAGLMALVAAVVSMIWWLAS